MAKEDALKWIAQQSAAVWNHADVFPCTRIAEGIGESVYKVRQYMKALMEEGYVTKAYEGGYNDWTDRVYCIHGYALTQKGADTPYYKDKYDAEVEWWNSRINSGG